MANGAISWASQQQKTVTLSVGEAEYMELASTGRQAAWLKSFNREIGFPIQEPVAHNTKTYYQQITGTLIYAAIGTRPDITFEATRLSQFNNNPTKEHIKYAKYVLRYLKGTKELKIKYDGSSDAGLIRYSDSDWGENRDDCHSTSGHIFLMANGAISWASQ